MLLPDNISVSNGCILSLILSSVSMMCLIQRNQKRNQLKQEVIKACTELVFNNKRKDNNDLDVSNKRQCKTKHNHERANNCIHEDYFSLSPIFDDKQFERMFRLRKCMVEKIIITCCNSFPKVFHPGPDAVGNRGIPLENKILMILKTIAYGVSPQAFKDYHQTGVNTCNLAKRIFLKHY